MEQGIICRKTLHKDQAVQSTLGLTSTNCLTITVTIKTSSTVCVKIKERKQTSWNKNFADQSIPQ